MRQRLRNTPRITRANPGELKATALVELARHPYRPAWWLRGPRRQTLVSAVMRTSRVPRFDLERWTTPDDDFVRIHLTADARPSSPLLLILHGLEGSVRSPNVASLTCFAQEAGWQIAVLEHRSCGGEMNRARRTYHAGETTDLGWVVERLGQRCPGRPILLVGISIGASILLNWLGALGASLPATVRGAAAISTPFDLRASADHVDRALGGAMARFFLRSMIPKAVAKARQFPGIVDIERIRSSRTFLEFDSAFTAPFHGFESAHHYWHTCSSKESLAAIRVPTLLVSARDDPLNPECTIPDEIAAASDYLTPLFTRRGGHGAFFAGANPWRAMRWGDSQILRFLELCTTDPTAI